MYNLPSIVTSGSWDDGGVISSCVGSTLMVLIGRGLSGRGVRYDRVGEVLP